MTIYACTCPVCRKAHDVETADGPTINFRFTSKPLEIIATNGRLGRAITCGQHSLAELQACQVSAEEHA